MLLSNSVRAEPMLKRAFQLKRAVTGTTPQLCLVALGHNTSEKPRSVAMRSGFSRIRCRCQAPHSSLGWLKGEAQLTAYQPEKKNAVECVLLPSESSPFDFCFWDFLEERI